MKHLLLWFALFSPLLGRGAAGLLLLMFLFGMIVLLLALLLGRGRAR